MLGCSGGKGAQALGRLGHAGAGRRADTGERTSGRGARGRRTLGKRARHARQGAAAGAGARRAGLAGRWARGLGARAGLGLCTRCTLSVFGPV